MTSKACPDTTQIPSCASNTLSASSRRIRPVSVTTAPLPAPAEASRGSGLPASLSSSRGRGRAQPSCIPWLRSFVGPGAFPGPSALAHARAQVAPSCHLAPDRLHVAASRWAEPTYRTSRRRLRTQLVQPTVGPTGLCSREPPPRLHRRCLTLALCTAPSPRRTHRRGFRTSAASAEGRRNPAGYQRVAPIFCHTRKWCGCQCGRRRLAIRGRRLAATPIRHGVRRMLCHSRRAHLLQFTSLLRCLSCGSERLQHR